MTGVGMGDSMEKRRVKGSNPLMSHDLKGVDDDGDDDYDDNNENDDDDDDDDDDHDLL